MFLGSGVAGLKSAAARRTFSTPRPVPVRIQSWAEQMAPSRNSSVKTASVRRLLQWGRLFNVYSSFFAPSGLNRSNRFPHGLRRWAVFLRRFAAQRPFTIDDPPTTIQRNHYSLTLSLVIEPELYMTTLFPEYSGGNGPKVSMRWMALDGR